MPIRGKRGNENEELRLLIRGTLKNLQSCHLNPATGTLHSSIEFEILFQKIF